MTDALPLLGFGLPVAGAWATPDALRRVAVRAEENGYASLWTFQRMLAPVGGESDPSANPTDRRADDHAYRSVLDPVVPLAYVAAHTDRIGLGTATICAPFTPPPLLAKTMATLDVVTGGRLTVGLGIGWLAQEYEAAGVPMVRRGARMEEYLLCLRALWTEDPVEFAGEFYRVPRSHVGPAPVQRPHPPVLLGGSAEPALRRAGRLAQGWIASSKQDLTTIGTCVATVRDAAQAVGRDPEAVRILVRVVVEITDDEPDGARRPLHGTRAQVLADLAALRAQGVTEVLIDLNFSPRITAPDVDGDEALHHAEHLLDALAPAGAAA